MLMETCEKGLDQQGMEASGGGVEAYHPSRPFLLTDCQLETDHDHFDNMWTCRLTSGKQWRKRIYPRVGYPNRLLRWATTEEILSYLVSFDSHSEWITDQVPQQPASGTIVFYNRSKTKKYRNDGYEWKKRKTASSSVREDRMKLKVGQYQLLYGCYAHSSSNPDLHRRTYWLINNPDIIMVHYLELSSSNYDIGKIVKGQVKVELADTPSDWSLLTVSDCNICALVNMVDEVTSTEIVLSQLSVIVNNNLIHATSLEEALVSNNEGLPFNMYLDTRSKKTNNSKVDVPSSPQLRSVFDSQASVPTSSNSVNSKEKMELFCTTPHFVMCQTPSGAMSCFVTIPPPTDSSSASLFPPGTKLPLPSLSHSLQMGLKASLRSGKSSKTKENVKNSPDNHQKYLGSKALDLLSKMLVLTKRPAVSTVNETAHEKNSDYNADSFSDFARYLSFDGTTSEIGRTTSGINEPHSHKAVISTNSDRDSGTNIPQSFDLPQPQTNILQPLHSSTSNFCNNLQDSDILNIDIGDRSVEQLLRLSPGLSMNDSANDLVQQSDLEPPLSPLTKLVNSLTAPSDETPVENNLGSTQIHSDTCNIQQNSTSNSLPDHEQSSLINPSLDFTANQHTSFQIPTYFSSPINSLSLNNDSNIMHSTQKPENHLLVDTANVQTPYPSDTLYSIPNTACNVNSFSEFSGSLLPAHEYEDLESLMNTIISTNNTEINQPASGNCTQAATISSFANHENAHELANTGFHALDTNSATSLASSYVSLQDQGPSHCFSLPDLTLEDHDLPQMDAENAALWSQFLSDHAQASTQSASARSSSCLSNVSGLQDIPEGSQMDLEEVPFMHQLDVCTGNYRTGVSSVPSSPGQGSVSSLSSLSANDVFDNGSPSVFELCEMLSESSNVQKHDFLHLTLSDSEQNQLFHAAKTIQSAFRKYKDRRQVRSQQKRAALLIEKYYKRYQETKKQQDHAARRIQQQYRNYRRSRDLNRAVLFVQQMYRYHRNKRGTS